MTPAGPPPAAVRAWAEQYINDIESARLRYDTGTGTGTEDGGLRAEG
ncbi:hypothetical protein ACFWIQ_08485 [Kitasatospora sp. NPDC127059]